jgi:hypothetical protein
MSAPFNNAKTAEIQKLFESGDCPGCREQGITLRTEGFVCNVYLGRRTLHDGLDFDCLREIGDLFTEVRCEDCCAILVDRTLWQALAVEEKQPEPTTDVRIERDGQDYLFRPLRAKGETICRFFDEYEQIWKQGALFVSGVYYERCLNVLHKNGFTTEGPDGSP